jgi:hypothetical protein
MSDEDVIPTADHVKYLGVHLDSHLNWSKHIFMKRKEAKLKDQSISWLFCAINGIPLSDKRLLYITVITPTAPVWGCAAKSSIKLLETAPRASSFGKW